MALHTAFILAGGRGSRLRPLTDVIPKPLVPIQGKPVLDYLLDLCKMHGVHNIILSVGYKADQLKKYYTNEKLVGLSMTYVEEQEPLGTAGPLPLAKHILKDTFVMSNADELKDINLQDMYSFHKKNNALGTIALTRVENPSDYGVARIIDGQIKEFVEKPKTNPPSNLINAGLYILEPEVISYVKKTPCSIEREVFPQLALEGRLFGYAFTGQWFDTGTPERYARAEKEWNRFSSSLPSVAHTRNETKN